MTNWLIYAKIANMAKLNYYQICSSLLNDLPERQKEVISRRFALSGAANKERETLESIGQYFGITRERVRQIEKDTLFKLKPNTKKYQKVSQYFKDYLKHSGNLKKEDILLAELGGKNWQNQVYFLLTLSDDFERFGETEDFYSFWTTNLDSVAMVKKIINSLYQNLKKTGKPVLLKKLSELGSYNQNDLISILEISKKIQRNSDNLFGLKEWPEINPRGVKDRAYLVLQKESRPLHFREVASLIPAKALPQTVHNELIKDSRFVLVGRGIYALKEWGYEKGMVKDVIFKTLKEAGRPLSKSEILDKVLKQRLVKENTILLNLSNKKYFSKISEGLYTIREA